ncbi:MAG TPA: hypothetical protein VMG12_38545, partial [Polyangiaceae bacterium]|nr:hypothetical protein [Polyangiaceae bacterium]
IGSAMMPVFSLATLGVEPHNAGLASALVTTAQQLGGGIGAALLNGLAGLAHPAAPAAAGSLMSGYGVAAAGGALLLALAALRAGGLPSSPLEPPQRPDRAANPAATAS